MTITAKQRYFAKRRKEAPLVKCACGCKRKIKSVDMYARPVKFVSGHNRRVYAGKDATPWAREKRWRVKNPDKIRIGKRDFYRKRKLLAMKIKGNKCTGCGLKYNGKNAPVFEFHHPDPSIKENGVTRLLVNKAWAKTLEELARCVLICANCHNQFHGGEW